jgi:hypothetical protein
VNTLRVAPAALCALLIAFGSATGCGSSDAEPAAGGAGGGGGSDAGVDSPTSDAGWPDASGDAEADAGPITQAYDPCATASCWTAPTLGVCGKSSINEDYSSGAYNVHHYLLMAPAGVDIELMATRTAGSWSPLLIVHDEQGTTVHDGTQSYSTSALQVSAVSPPSPDAVAVQIKASTRMHLGVYLTGASVVSSGFADALPTDAKYSLEATLGCTPPPSLSVRGVTLSAKQELWIRYIGEQIVPLVPGTASERIDKSAYVAWWALKEDVLDYNNPLSYSNCSIPPDQHIGPVELCPNPNNAWQVGISGVQATYTTLPQAETIASTVYPQLSIEEVLTDAAVKAGFGATTQLGQTVATSSDRLETSWLLRNGPVGFERQYPTVYDECFVQALSWCFGSGWPSTASFAPTQAGAQQSVADLKAIFQTLAP